MTEPTTTAGEAAGFAADRRPLRDFLMVSAVYLAFSILLPVHRFDFDKVSPGIQVALIIVPTAVFMLLQLLLTRSIVRLRLKPWQYLVGGLSTILVWYMLEDLAYGRRPFHSGLKLFIASAVIGICLTVCLSCFGSLLSLIIRERNLLLPVALIAMPIDFIGAMTSLGFTHDMVIHAPKIVSRVSVSVPGISSHSHHGINIGPIAFIGPGDVMFMALFFAAVQKFELNENRTFRWMYALLTISMILVLRLPNLEVGALVPMGLAVIIANGSLIKLKRDEVYAVVYAGALILALVGLFFWSSHRYLFHAH